MGPPPLRDDSAAVVSAPVLKDVKILDPTQVVTASAGDSVSTASAEPARGCCSGPYPRLRRVRKVIFSPKGAKEWTMCVLFWLILTAAGVTLFVVIFPQVVDRVFLPLTAAIRRRFTSWQIAGIGFVAYTMLPIFVVVPFIWVGWLLGMVLPFWKAYLIVMSACAVHLTIKYALGRTVLHKWVQRRLEQDRNKRIQALLRAVDLVGAWKFTALIRLVPYPPYQLTSYLLTVPQSIKYWIYITASLPASAPGRALQVLFGQNLGGIADLLRGRIHNPGVAAYQIIILAAGAVLLCVLTWFAKKALRQVEEEECAREAAEQEAAQQQQLEAVDGDLEAGKLQTAAAGGKDVDMVPDQPDQQAPSRAADGQTTLQNSSAAGRSMTDLQVVVGSGKEGAAAARV